MAPTSDNQKKEAQWRLKLLHIAWWVLALSVMKDWLLSGASEVAFPYRSLTIMTAALLWRVTFGRRVDPTKSFLFATLLLTAGGWIATDGPWLAIDALAVVACGAWWRRLRGVTAVAILGALVLCLRSFAPGLTGLAPVLAVGLLFGLLTGLKKNGPTIYGWGAVVILTAALAQIGVIAMNSNVSDWIGTGLGTGGSGLTAIAKELGFGSILGMALLFGFGGAEILSRFTNSEPVDPDLRVGSGLLLLFALYFLVGGPVVSSSQPVGVILLTLGEAMLVQNQALFRISLVRSRRGVWIAGIIAGVFVVASVAFFILEQARASAELEARLAKGPWKSGEFIGVAEIPASLRDSTVAMEDGHFWEHSGFDLAALHRAIRIDLRRGAFEQGGSTITQQAARYAFVGKQKTLSRKIQEAFMTTALERRLSKMEILSIYLSSADYGFHQIGVRQAAHFYFNTGCKDLSLDQSLFLVSLVPHPPRNAAELQKALDRRQTAAYRLTAWFPGAWPTDVTEAAAKMPADQLLKLINIRPFLSSIQNFR